MATFAEGWLDQTAIVYEEAPDGTYTQVVTPILNCRVLQIPYRTAVDLRKEIGLRKRFWYPSGYNLLSNHAVFVDGILWTVVEGTFMKFRGIDGTVEYNRCEIERLDT